MPETLKATSEGISGSGSPPYGIPCRASGSVKGLGVRVAFVYSVSYQDKSFSELGGTIVCSIKNFWRSYVINDSFPFIIDRFSQFFQQQVYRASFVPVGQPLDILQYKSFG